MAYRTFSRTLSFAEAGDKRPTKGLLLFARESAGREPIVRLCSNLHEVPQLTRPQEAQQQSREWQRKSQAGVRTGPPRLPLPWGAHPGIRT